MAAGQSSTLRRAGSFLALVAFEVGAVVLLAQLGRVPALRIPWHSLTPWLLNSPVEDVLAAILRMIALLIAWWLLCSNLLYLFASLTRIPSTVRAVRWVTLPVVRSITDHAVALALATSIVGSGAGASIAAATPAVAAAPLRPGAMTSGQDDPRAQVSGGHLSVHTHGAAGTAGAGASRVGAAEAMVVRYSPQPAGQSSGGGQQEPGPGQPGYVPKPAGNQPESSSSSSSSSSTSTSSSTSSTSSTGPPTSTTGYVPSPAGPPSSTTTSRPPTSTTEPPTSTSTSTTEPPTSTSTTAPPTSTSRPTTTTGYLPNPAGPPSSTTTSRPPTSTTEPPTSTTEPPTSTTHPPTSTTHPPTSTTRPPGGGSNAPSPTPPQRGEQGTHTVVEGDNLWVISRNRLAQVTQRPASRLPDHEIAAYWLRVVAANRDNLRSGDPDMIFPGEVIQLPPISSS